MQINKYPQRWAGIVLLILGFIILGMENVTNPITSMDTFLSLLINNWYVTAMVVLGLYLTLNSIIKQQTK